MEMDCYPEYKHHIHPNHQHYNSNVAANHSYYPGNYGPTAMRYAHAHSSYAEAGHQQNWIDGYSRYNHTPHHLNPHGNFPNSFTNTHYGQMRDNYHQNSEASSQFYYQNSHQTSASYYGNHSYESYRNASTGYHYHYGAGAYHQSPVVAAPPTQHYYPPYNVPTEQFNNRYYPTPPPSVPPTSSQRDPYSLTHPGEGPLSSYVPTIENESREKINSERLTIEKDKSSTVDPIVSSPTSSISSPTMKQSTENGENVDGDRKPESQQDLSPHISKEPNESEKLIGENSNKATKVDGCLDSEEKEKNASEHENQQTSPLLNETCDQNQHQLGSETSTKTNDGNSQESPPESSVATDYQYQQTERDLQNNRHRKSFREKEKCLKGSNANRKSFDTNSNANDPFNRCSTPFASMPSSPFNHNQMPPHSYPPHQRLPPNFPHAAAAQNYWYSQQHPPPHPQHNWMMNPYMRNRRATDAPQMLPSSIQYNRNEKHKVYEEPSPPPKRTKRKPKADPTIRNEPKEEIMKNVTPLPGFLQTFGGTEIGRFSEAFFTTSESPNPYYNNSIESDVESPQPWDFDSLDGPVNMQVGAAFQVYGSETEYDSPINNFSEIMCNDY